MRRVRRIEHTIAVVVVSVGVAVVATAPAADAAESSRQPSVHTQATGHGYITTVRAPDGGVTRIYSAVPVTLREFAQTSVTQLRADGTTHVVHSAGGVIMPEPGAAKLAGASTITASDELRALGASPAAVSSFDGFDSGPTTVEDAATSTAARSVKPSSSPSWEPLCVNKNYDSNHLQLSGCLSQYHIGSSGAVWYMEDKFLATGIMNDSGIDPDEITGLKFGDSYGSGNSIYTWAPSSTAHKGSCVSTTVSVEYKGVGISSTKDECPETFGPVTKNATQFVSKWDGQGNGPSDEARSTEGVDGTYNGASASPHAGIIYYVWWE